MTGSSSENRWEQLKRERADARASLAFAGLGSNRVPETVAVDADSSDEVLGRIRYIVSHSKNSKM